MNLTQAIPAPWQGVAEFLIKGGPAMWAIALLSVLTLALILGKLWQLLRWGAWRRGTALRATALWQQNRPDAAQAMLAGRRSPLARLALAAMQAARTTRFSPDERREDVTRVARSLLAEATSGLRILEMIATIAPLLGLLGTVLGMITAFQTLQNSGSQADPAQLAGGIWEALLTTAAGMAVAIPASMALSWFESLRDDLARDMEDLATRILLSPPRNERTERDGEQQADQRAGPWPEPEAEQC